MVFDLHQQQCEELFTQNDQLEKHEGVYHFISRKDRNIEDGDKKYGENM